MPGPGLLGLQSTWKSDVVIAAVETLQLILMIILVVVAVGAGLWVGKGLGETSRKARKLQGRGRDKESLATSIGKSAQDLISGSAVRVWKWRRERKREQRDKS